MAPKRLAAIRHAPSNRTPRRHVPDQRPRRRPIWPHIMSNDSRARGFRTTAGRCASPPSRPEHQALFGDKPVAEVVLAREDDVVVGFALFYHNFSTFLGKRGLHLEDLFVCEEYRRHGYGRAMLIHVARPWPRSAIVGASNGRCSTGMRQPSRSIKVLARTSCPTGESRALPAMRCGRLHGRPCFPPGEAMNGRRPRCRAGFGCAVLGQPGDNCVLLRDGDDPAPPTPMTDFLQANFKNLKCAADFWSLRAVDERVESYAVRKDVLQPPALDTDRGAMLTASCRRRLRLCGDQRHVGGRPANRPRPRRHVGTRERATHAGRHSPALPRPAPRGEYALA